MPFPRQVRYPTLSRILCSSLVTFLLFTAFCCMLAIEFFSVYQGTPPLSVQIEPHPLAEEETHRLILEKRDLKSKLNRCRADCKNTLYSKTLKYLRKENARLAEKVNYCRDPGKWQRKNNPLPEIAEQTGIIHADGLDNVVVSREFFNYLANNLHNTSYPGVDNYTRYTVARLGLSPLSGVEPLIAEFGPVINDVLSFRYPISVPSCQSLSSDVGNVFIVVNSAPTNFGRRDNIRQTWKNHLNPTLLHLEKGFHLGIAGFAFFLGQTQDKETQSRIEEESETFGDIIQVEMTDFYDDLPLKVAGQFNWLYKYCAKVDFVFKVDDDVYVNVRNLAHFVQSYHHQSNLSMFGSSLDNNFSPERNGKWNVSFDDWPWKEYPPYLLGPAVLFHGSTLLPLLAAFQTTPMIRFDDLYYTGICAEKTGIKVHHSSDSTGALQQHMHLNMAFTTSVFSMEIEMSGSPLACDLRRFIAWLVDYEALMPSVNHMKSSHIATDNFYRNVTKCIITKPNGTKRTIDHSKPVQFYFTLV